MMEGKAELILTDTRTGEQRRIFEKNLVTNALEYFNNDRVGIIGFNISDSSSLCFQNISPICPNIIGGLILFDRALPENSDQIWAPANADDVGHASLDSYSGDDTRRGNFNHEESGPHEDGKGYTFVWDFPTSKANGTIGCMCLTTPQGGCEGYAAPNSLAGMQTKWYEKAEKWIGGSTVHKGYGEVYATEKWTKIASDTNQFYYSGKVYTIDTTNGADFTITSQELRENQIGLVYSAGNLPPEKTTTVRVGIFADNAAEFYSPTSAYHPAIAFENGFFHLLWVCNAQTNGGANAMKKMAYAKISAEGSLETEKMIDTGGRMVQRSYASSYYYYNNDRKTNVGFAVIEDRLVIAKREALNDEYMPEGTHTLYEFRISDGAFVAERRFPNMKKTNSYNCVLFAHDGRIYWNGYAMDSEGRVRAQANAQASGKQRRGHIFDGRGNGSSNNANISYQTNMLFTINNLSIPATKTSADTMKIKYVLKEV